MKKILYDKIKDLIYNLSQELNRDQIVQYIYPLIHETIEMGNSCLYLQDVDDLTGNYILRNHIGYEHIDQQITYNDKLRGIATFHGRIITKDFEVYFDKALIEMFNPSYIIPLIFDDNLIGFIIVSKDDSYTDEELRFLETVEKIININISRLIYQSKYRKTAKVLNQEIYNLALVNHLSKLIISEMDIEKLYTFCVDAIREITASGTTTLGVYEAVTNSIPICHMKDIVHNRKFFIDFNLNEYDVNEIKFVYSIKDDFEDLEKIFTNAKDLHKIDAEYIIFILNDRIEGFITIGKAVNEKDYDDNILKQVKNIVSFIYIAIKNAKNFLQIQKNSQDNKKQVNTLKNLNYAIKNITTCSDIPTLAEVALETLKFQFDFQNGAFLVLKDHDVTVQESFGFDSDNITYDLENLKKIPKKLFYSFTKDIQHDFIQLTTDDNCLVIAPIVIEDILEDKVLGYIITTRVTETLKNFQITALETIVNSIAPIMNSFEVVNDIKQAYKIDDSKAFISELTDHIEEKKLYGVDFYINYTKLNIGPFDTYEEPSDDKHYTIKNYIFNLSYEINPSYDHSFQVESLNEFYDVFNT